jgi:glycolate oxidase iron-sulfur subunit
MKNIKDTKKCMNIDEIAAVCSDCGNCLFACPVYNAELLEPTSPRGKVNLIKWLRDGRLKPDRLNKKFIYQCALCGSCQHICTKGVEFMDMMIDYRTVVAGGKKIPFFKKMILWLYQSIIFKKLTGVVDILAKTPLRNKLTIPRRRKAKIKALYSKRSKQAQYDVLFFPGCVLTYFYPEIIEKIVSFFKKKGFSVVIPQGMECCGFPYFSQGWKEKFISFKKKNKAIFSQFRFRYLVVPCGTGVMTFKNYYEFEEEAIEIYELTEFFYRHIKDAVIDTTQFNIEKHDRPTQPETIKSFCGGLFAKRKAQGAKRIIRLPLCAKRQAPSAPPLVAEGKSKKITFHDPCHHLKSLGIAAAPRFFMEQLEESFIDDKSALCCGFGGIFSVGFPSTSKKILKRKEETLKELGADTVVTACPGCYLQLRENLSHNKDNDIDVKFFIDLFD